MMSFDAFRFNQDQPEGKLFAEALLSSYDFDQPMLKNVCRDLGLQVSGVSRDLIIRIVNKFDDDPITVQQAIAKSLITRTKSAIAFKMIPDGTSFQTGRNLQDLVVSPGEKEWYGPVSRTDDEGAYWYVRPIFLPHSEMNENAENEEDRIIELVIRWNCFARIANGIVSLHWHGFTYQNPDTLNPRSRAQFPYWRHIPKLFIEMEELLGTRLINIRFHGLILDTVLEQYRRNPAYDWNDDRIRAEAGGVALNARSGARNRSSEVENSENDVERDLLDTEGINYLAVTIRTAIQTRLLDHYGIDLPDPEEFDEEILITLIKKYGTQSYELQVQSRETGLLFRAHCYFGAKPNSYTPDAFAHFQLKAISRLSDLNQLNFLREHLDREAHREHDDD